MNGNVIALGGGRPDGADVIPINVHEQKRAHLRMREEQFDPHTTSLARYVSDNMDDYLAAIASVTAQPVIETQLFGGARTAIHRCEDSGSAWGIIDYLDYEDGEEVFEVSDGVIKAFYDIFELPDGAEALEFASRYVAGFVVGTAVAQELGHRHTPHGDYRLGQQFEELAQLTTDLQSYRFAAGALLALTPEEDVPELKRIPSGRKPAEYIQSLYIPMLTEEMRATATLLN